MIKELIPVIKPSDAEQKAIAEMNSRFSQDATTANAARLHRKGAEARSKAPTKVAEIEWEIANEREVQDRSPSELQKSKTFGRNEIAPGHREIDDRFSQSVCCEPQCGRKRKTI